MYTPVLIQQECCEFKEAFVDRQGDVYVASGGDEPGVWEVENVLEATSLAGEFEPQTLSVEVEDVPGVLNQVCLHLCLQTLDDCIQPLATHPQHIKAHLVMEHDAE